MAKSLNDKHIIPKQSNDEIEDDPLIELARIVDKDLASRQNEQFETPSAVDKMSSKVNEAELEHQLSMHLQAEQSSMEQYELLHQNTEGHFSEENDIGYYNDEHHGELNRDAIHNEVFEDEVVYSDNDAYTYEVHPYDLDPNQMDEVDAAYRDEHNEAYNDYAPIEASSSAYSGEYENQSYDLNNYENNDSVLPAEGEAEGTYNHYQDNQASSFLSGGMMTVLAVMGIFVVGGGGVIGYRMMNAYNPDEPQIIVSNIENVKIRPSKVKQVEDQVGKIVYDRMESSQRNQEKRSVNKNKLHDTLSKQVNDNKPDVDNIPFDPLDNFEPRRVRTVVVRPDGTIIRSIPDLSDQSADIAASHQDYANLPNIDQDESDIIAQQGQEKANTRLDHKKIVRQIGEEGKQQVPSNELPTETRNADPLPTASVKTKASDRLSPILTNTDNNNQVASLNPSELQKPSELQDGQTSVGQNQRSIILPPLPVRRPQGGGSRRSVKQPAKGPLVLTSPGQISTQRNNATVPNTSQQASLQGDYVVQVSSQKSRTLALTSFQDLKRRYPSLLGRQTPDIKQVSLGEKGTFYRVRIRAGTRQQANALCQNLKSAGGDCLVRRQ